MFESNVKAVNNFAEYIKDPDGYWKKKVDNIFKEVLGDELKSKSKFHIFIK